MNSKRILSFDIGIKNLSFLDANVAYSENQRPQITINGWDVLDISITPTGHLIDKKDYSSLSDNLLLMLHQRFDPRIYTHVVIENQPVTINPTMKSLQIALSTYFQLARVTQNNNNLYVKFMNAGGKLKPNIYISQLFLDSCDPKKTSDKTPTKMHGYVWRKKWSVACATQLLTQPYTKFDILNHDTWSTQFFTHKKKDDLADTLMMALAALASYV